MDLIAPPADFVPPTRVVAPPRLSHRVPALYPVAVRVHRARRRLRWLTSPQNWATARDTEPLTHRVKVHKSLLMRELGEDEMALQRNKVVNLRLAAERTDGMLIGPGETLSFNKTVGNCTRAKGYLPGMRLSNGRAVAGVGGGICQLANLLHWMFLHSPLTVVERSEHSFDPFPDKARVLPWGVGCSIVYNYVDLVVTNHTEATFQLRTRVGERYLEGELRADRELPHSYRVFAEHEQFIRAGDEYFRRNEIWRSVRDRRTGDVVDTELMKRNCARVSYTPVGRTVIDLSLAPAAAPATAAAG